MLPVNQAILWFLARQVVIKASVIASVLTMSSSSVTRSLLDCAAMIAPLVVGFPPTITTVAATMRGRSDQIGPRQELLSLG
jgi:hypothetical protein